MPRILSTGYVTYVHKNEENENMKRKKLKNVDVNAARNGLMKRLWTIVKLFVDDLNLHTKKEEQYA